MLALIDHDLDRTLDEIARLLVFATTQYYPSLDDIARWEDTRTWCLASTILMCTSLGDVMLMAGDADVMVLLMWIVDVDVVWGLRLLFHVP